MYTFVYGLKISDALKDFEKLIKSVQHIKTACWVENHVFTSSIKFTLRY